MPARKGKIWRNLDGYDSAPQFARQGEMRDAKLGGLPPMPQIIQLFAQEPYDVPNLRGGVLTGDKEREPRIARRFESRIVKRLGNGLPILSIQLALAGAQLRYQSWPKMFTELTRS